MSKASKCIDLQNRSDFSLVRKAQSQSVFPRSAIKQNQSFYERPRSKKPLSKKAKQNEQFELTHRKRQKTNNFLSYHRMKSLILPVTHLKTEDLRNFSILGTFDTKIIVGFNEKLKLFCFFDQHAMHERIRYEFYLDRLSDYDKAIKSTKKWTLSIIQKDKRNIEVISGIRHCYTSLKVFGNLNEMVQQDIFVSKYGFQVHYVKKQKTLKITRTPMILERKIENKTILNIAHQLVFNPDKLPKNLQEIIAEISCKSAFKFNDEIDTGTIKDLIQNLSICQYPFFCVHGRPTLFTRI